MYMNVALKYAVINNVIRYKFKLSYTIAFLTVADLFNNLKLWKLTAKFYFLNIDPINLCFYFKTL